MVFPAVWVVVAPLDVVLQVDPVGSVVKGNDAHSTHTLDVAELLLSFDKPAVESDARCVLVRV